MAAPETPQQEYERLYGKVSAQTQETPEQEYQRLYRKPAAAKVESPAEEYKRLYGAQQPAAPQPAAQPEPSLSSRFMGAEDVEEYEQLPESLKPVKTALNVVRSGVSGEIVPQAVDWVRHLFGDDKEKTGATVSRELELERRGGGMLPEYRQLSGGAVDKTVQFLANAAGDVVGMVGSVPALATEALTMAGRDIGRGAGALTTDLATMAYRHGFEQPAKSLFGEVAAKALAHQQQDGQWTSMRAIKDSLKSKGEFLQGMAFGLSPGVYEAARAVAQGEDPVDAGWEAFKAFPVATILPFYHGVAKPAMKAGGEAVVRGGEPIQTVTGKELVLNKAGQKVFEPVTQVADTKVVKELKGAVGDTVREALDWGKRVVEPEWQRVAFDAVPARSVFRQRALTEGNKALAVAESQSARNMKEAVTQYNLLRDIDAELADPQYAGATPVEKLAAIEGTLKDTVKTWEAPVIDKNSRATAQALGEKFVELGMKPEDAQLAVPYSLFEGVRAAKAGNIQDPFKVLTDLQSQLSNMDKDTAAKFVESYATNVRAQMTNPAFIAAADQAWSGKGYRWVPGAEIRQRDGYAQAMKAAQKTAQESGRPSFEINIPELGELRKDYVYQLYDNLVDDLHSSPESRERIAYLLASNPISRIAANPTAPVHTQALAAWYNQPGGKRRQLADLLNQAGIESARNMGVDPVVIAKRYDSYISRAFTDHIDGAVKLNDYIKLMEDDPELASKLGKDFVSARHKRRLSRETSNERFTEMVSKGDISLHDALAGTVVNSMAMNTHLEGMSSLYDLLKPLNMVHDSPGAGRVQLSTEKAAPTERAASGREYNLAYGKMGGKWVDPWVARQLDLMPTGFKALSETMPALQFLNNFTAGALGLMRTTHTQFNVPQYGLRNAIQDPLPAMAASGLTPYLGVGKKIMRAAQADTDRFIRTRDNPTGAVISPTIREMIDVGLFDPDRMPAMSELPSAVRDQVKQMALNINRTTIEATNPAEHVNLMARAVAHTRALGKSISTDVPKSLLLALRDSIEDRKAAVASGEANIPASLGAASKYLQHVNQHLNDTALALSLSQAEQTRTIWTYRVAREHLKLDKERAAIFTRETMYGHERPSPEMVSIMNSGLALVGVVPLFLRYGIWQTQRFTQRTLAHPHLWASYAIAKGLDAVNENELLSEPNGENNWKHRLAEIHTKHTAVADVGLGTVAGIQEAGRYLGVPESILKTLGKPDDPIIAGLSDIIGGQTFLHQIDPRKSGLNYIFQLGLFGGNLAQLADPNKQLEGAADIGLAPGESGFWPSAREVAKGFSAKILPSSQVVNYNGWRIPLPMGRTIQAIAGFAAGMKHGEMPYRNAYGDRVNPVNEISRALGPGMPNIIDSTAAMRSVSKAMKANAMQFNMDLHKHQLKRVDPNIEAELRNAILTENQINSAAKMQQMRLSFAWQYNFLTRAEALAASKKMEELRKKAIADVNRGGKGGNILSDMFSDSKINAASDAVTKAMMDAGEEIIDNEEENLPTNVKED